MFVLERQQMINGAVAFERKNHKLMPGSNSFDLTIDGVFQLIKSASGAYSALLQAPSTQPPTPKPQASNPHKSTTCVACLGLLCQDE